jgi:hypothetical protein
MVPALLSNIKLGWKGLPGASTLAYLSEASVTKPKSFITLTQGANVIKLFS